MTATELQDLLENAIEALIDAREEMDGEDDDGTMADIARDLVGDLIDQEDGIKSVRTFGAARLLTRDDGLLLRMADGSEFQLSIVQSR